jgi:PAS domain S-box-containing protein
MEKNNKVRIMKPNKGNSTPVNGGLFGVSNAGLSLWGEVAFDAMLTLDSQRHITYWNPAAQQMYGWTAEEVLGKTVEELFWSAGSAQEEAEQRERRKKVDRGEIVRGEYQPCRKDGSSFWVEFISRAVFDEQGGILGYIATHRDITERKRLQDDIVLIAKLPSENPNPIMRLSHDGQLVYANDASEPLLNYWKQKTNQVISDELQRDVQEVFQANSKKVIEIEYDGKTLSCTLVPIRETGYVNFYGNDITERRKASRELRQSNAELRDQMNEMETLMEILPIGVWIGNHDCSVITGNPAAYQIMGLEPGINASFTNPASETPSGVRIFVEGQEVPPEKAPMQVVARTGKPLYNIEHEILFEDGKRKAVLANIVPVLDEQGTVRKVIGAYVDLTERKRTEDALRQSEERFTQFMQHLPGLAWIKDVQGHYVYANSAAEKAFHTPQERLYGSTDEEIFPPEVAAQFKKNDEMALTENKGILVIEILEHDDGAHYSLVSKFPIPGPDGNTALIGGTAFDITERKHAEDALQIRARQQQAVAKLGELALRESNLQKVFDFTTRAVSETLGIEYCKVLELLPGGKEMFLRAGSGWKDGLVGRATVGTDIDTQAGFTLRSNAPVVVYDLSEEKRFTVHWLLGEHGVISGMSCIIRSPGGTPWGVISAHATQQMNFSQDDISFLAAIANILGDAIQREQAEHALRESEKRFAGVVNSAMDAIISADAEQRIVLFNPAAEKMFGCTASGVIGQPLERFIPSRHREPHKEHILRFGQTGETGRAMGHLNTLSALRFDGTEFPIEASISHIEAGRQHLYTVILRDVTERKRAEDALLESQMEMQILNDTLEQKVQAQTTEIRKLASELTKAEQRERNRVARILHDDLQQRLYAIQIQVTSLSERYVTGSEKGQKDFDRIHGQLQEAVLLTRHLSIDLSPPILHDEGLTQAVEWLASQMKKQYGLQVELKADESYANPDEDLRVLVFNCIRELLFNIVKHAGGGKARVVLQRANSNLRVEVRDEGKGFDAAEISWQTLNVPEKDGPHSQSFGLSTIYHQLNLFGGQMEIQSEPGKGTLVTITIPYP